MRCIKQPRQMKKQQKINLFKNLDVVVIEKKL